MDFYSRMKQHNTKDTQYVGTGSERRKTAVREAQREKERDLIGSLKDGRLVNGDAFLGLSFEKIGGNGDLWQTKKYEDL